MTCKCVPEMKRVDGTCIFCQNSEAADKAIIYVALIEDRHCDAGVCTFSDRDKAISEAQGIAKERCRYREYYKEHDCSDDEDWVFHAVYSYEGDCVTVIKTLLN